MSSLENLQKELIELAAHAVPPKVSFFKTGKGDYAEHDQFCSISTPVLRKLSKKYYSLSLTDIETILQSPINEYRLLALFLLTTYYEKGKEEIKESIFQLYLSHLNQVNNWNLVDSSAHLIIGHRLFNQDRKLLYKLVKSNSLWERRIAIIATWYFIRHHQYDDTLKLATVLLNDPQDLIHKATGWMLREVGKRDKAALVHFLDQYSSNMPRTMLRYAIEKFTPSEQKYYLSLKKI